MVNLTVNGVGHEVDVEAEMPLLWALRDELGLTGTKFGCGIASCGACTVHVNGNAVRSCVTPVGAVAGQEITTIEGLASEAGGSGGSGKDGLGAVAATDGIAGPGLSDIQRAWVEHQVPQCGYCQSGMIMAVSAFLARNPKPSDAEIDANITNICRCGSYPRVRKAIRALTA